MERQSPCLGLNPIFSTRHGYGRGRERGKFEGGGARNGDRSFGVFETMSTSTFTVSNAFTVTYVTTKMLLVLKEIIREIGLDPSRFMDDFDTYENAVSTWISSRHLQRITLEVYNPKNDELVRRWDIEVTYTTIGEGHMWVDTSAVRYAIAKAGLAPSSCSYDIKLRNAPGRPHVPGWGPCDLRSTDGFQRHSIGAIVGGNGLHGQTAYWTR
jgi:hypothetical protein